MWLTLLAVSIGQHPVLAVLASVVHRLNVWFATTGAHPLGLRVVRPASYEPARKTPTVALTGATRRAARRERVHRAALASSARIVARVEATVAVAISSVRARRMPEAVWTIVLQQLVVETRRFVAQATVGVSVRAGQPRRVPTRQP